jgi:serine/threonine protein kinase
MPALNCPDCGHDILPPEDETIDSVTCPGCDKEIDIRQVGTMKISPVELSPGHPVSQPTSVEDDVDLPDGTVIGPYTLRNLLGRGGMGAVYKADHKELDRTVAIKILPSKLSKDPEFTERFRREAKVLAQLSHPNIVQIFDLGTQGEILYLAMEYVDGVNIRDVLQTQELKPEQALHIVPRLCEALEYAHSKGVVHRDIKPDNILLDKEGNPKVADFGLAKIVRGDTPPGTLTRTGLAMGTPDYMAPEQREETKNVDHRADIYSMGVVLYEMLTGKLPIGDFELPSRKVTVDLRMDEVVVRALANDPERRYQRASHMGMDVKHITQTPGAKAPAPSGSARHVWNSITPMQRFLHVLVGLGAVFFLVFLALFVGGGNPAFLIPMGVFGIMSGTCAIVLISTLKSDQNVVTRGWANLSPRQKRHVGQFLIINAALWIFFLGIGTPLVPLIITCFWGMAVALDLWKAQTDPSKTPSNALGVAEQIADKTSEVFTKVKEATESEESEVAEEPKPPKPRKPGLPLAVLCILAAIFGAVLVAGSAFLVNLDPASFEGPAGLIVLFCLAPLSMLLATIALTFALANMFNLWGVRGPTHGRGINTAGWLLAFFTLALNILYVFPYTDRAREVERTRREACTQAIDAQIDKLADTIAAEGDLKDFFYTEPTVAASELNRLYGDRLDLLREASVIYKHSEGRDRHWVRIKSGENWCEGLVVDMDETEGWNLRCEKSPEELLKGFFDRGQE